jgi:Anti-sigma-K factor rskA/Putative zinc-finger
MSDPTARPGSPEHEDYEALAAGYALHALEPEDEQQLSAHLMNCPTCARLVADTAALGAAFADLLEPEAPPPGLRERVLAAAAASPRGMPDAGAAPQRIDLDAAPAEPKSARPSRTIRRRFARPEVRMRLAVGALAAALGVAVAVPVTLAASHHPASGDTALTQALLQKNAREMTLTSASGPGLAKAVVSDKGVVLLADGLRPNDRSRNVYVLWAADAAGQRRAVATFDVSSRGTVQLASSRLPYSAAQIAQMAISFESGRSAPVQPTDVVLTSSA